MSHDAVIVGGGHNGLVAATLLARAGLSVLVLERRAQLGGAAVSGAPFPGVDARVSQYAYLVSLFPAALARELGLTVELRRRRIAAYTPWHGTGLLIDEDERRTERSMLAITGDPRAIERWQDFHGRLARLATRLFPTLTEPLRSREELRALIDDDQLFTGLFDRPLAELLEASFASDPVRGLVLTDAQIGTFAAAEDPSLRQNRCFLYHVIGNGTGRWDVPVGGIGALTEQLAGAAAAAGAELACEREVVAIDAGDGPAEVLCADGQRFPARHVLANVAPAVLGRLTGAPRPAETPEGSQLKLNMVVSRLPRLRDPEVSSAEAFTGTFHVNEGYQQLRTAHAEAAAGAIPQLPPCELYCHSLTDPSILSPELRAAGAQTLTAFVLHMPARLFAADPATAKREAVAATLRSIDSVLAEPLADCLLRDRDGAPCLEAHTPPELEQALGLPGGHIFHRDLAWPYAETEAERGRWGVETELSNLWLCGAGARRGGAVSGIPGHNAARAVLAAEGV